MPRGEFFAVHRIADRQWPGRGGHGRRWRPKDQPNLAVNGRYAIAPTGVLQPIDEVVGAVMTRAGRGGKKPISARATERGGSGGRPSDLEVDARCRRRQNRPPPSFYVERGNRLATRARAGGGAARRKGLSLSRAGTHSRPTSNRLADRHPARRQWRPALVRWAWS